MPQINSFADKANYYGTHVVYNQHWPFWEDIHVVSNKLYMYRVAHIHVL